MTKCQAGVATMAQALTVLCSYSARLKPVFHLATLFARREAKTRIKVLTVRKKRRIKVLAIRISRNWWFTIILLRFCHFEASKLDEN